MSTEDSEYEYAFDPDAPNSTAASIYAMAREGGPRVLDLGSGPGIVAGHLATADGRDVTCVDANPTSLAVATERGATRTVVADLNNANWFDDLGDDPFDVIILADVLEHLFEPEAVLRSID